MKGRRGSGEEKKKGGEKGGEKVKEGISLFLDLRSKKTDLGGRFFFSPAPIHRGFNRR